MGQTVGVFLTGKAALMREFGPGFVGKTAVGWAAWKGENAACAMACWLLMHSSGQQLAIQNKRRNYINPPVVLFGP
jgi:hypothetical protein